MNFIELSKIVLDYYNIKFPKNNKFKDFRNIGHENYVEIFNLRFIFFGKSIHFRIIYIVF